MLNKLKNVKDNIISLKIFENFIKRNIKNIVFVCVGNSNVWYDSFGPIVGTLLKHKYNLPLYIYGDINNNIKLNNLNDYIDWIYKKHYSNKIIVIDAALSNFDYNGLIFKNEGTKCAYFDKNSIPFGDFSILCPVKEYDNSLNFCYKNIINNTLILCEVLNNIYNKMYK